MKQILIDLDGVLADYISGTCQLHNRPNPFLDPTFRGDQCWNYYRHWGIEEADFYAKQGRDFFYELSPYRWTNDLVRMCELVVGPDQVGILTTPVLTRGCCDGKRDWVARHLGKHYRNRTLLGYAKYFCARPDTLLIDDREKNVNEFIAHGGQAVLFPQHWNRLHAQHSTALEVVAEHLEAFRDN